MNNLSEIIVQQANQQGISVAKLARLSNLSSSSMYKMLRNDDFKVSRIIQFSRLLRHDFFQYIRTTPTTKSPEFKALQLENKQLQQTIETLRQQNTLLTDFVQVLKAQTKQNNNG